MNCTINVEHLAYNKNSLVVWYFQPCTSIFCDNSYNYLEVSNETEWIKLNHSSPILYIENLNVDRDSGLYRCSVEPYKIKQNVTLNIQFVMNHHLVVIGECSFRLLTPFSLTLNLFQIVNRTSHTSWTTHQLTSRPLLVKPQFFTAVSEVAASSHQPSNGTKDTKMTLFTK